MSSHHPSPATGPDDGPLAGIRRALVIGLGRSGQVAARALRDAGVTVIVVDDRPTHPDAPLVEAAGFDVRLGTCAQDLVDDDLDLVVPSPGVPEGAPALVAALERGIPVWSEPELGYRLAPRRVLGVTGTNGKTSTTELLTAMLLAGGVDAMACGNLGVPFTEVALTCDPDAVLVAELSSFQLRFAHTLRAEVGVLLNLAPDHLDWHGTIEAYAAAKARLWRSQRPGDWAVSNDDDEATGELRDEYAPASVASFSNHAPVRLGVGVTGGRLVAFDRDRVAPYEPGDLIAIDQLPLGAPHHVANVAAAATAAWLAGVPLNVIAGVAAATRPGRHRLELVADRSGVQFVDDSKATNVHAAIAALRASDSTVWIAGGLAKGVDLTPLGSELEGVRAAVLIGTSAHELAAICRDAGVEVRLADTMQDAVRQAAELAQPGDRVLLSPACASFDQFRDYTERGDRFAAAARSLPGARAIGFDHATGPDAGSGSASRPESTSGQPPHRPGGAS